MLTPGGVLDPGDVLVENGRIAAVAAKVRADDCAVFEADGMIVSPGFVDTHRHVWQTQLRTVAADWSLFDYFARMRCVYSALYTPDDVYLGNRVGALEAIDAGITTVVDHCHVLNSPDHADEAVRGLHDAGIRGVFCYGLFANPTLPDFEPETDSGWRCGDLRRLARERFASPDSLLQLGVAPSEAEAIPFDRLRDEIALAREIGARALSLHVAMGAYDTGQRIVGRLAEAGLLDEDLLFVHGAALSDDELESIADSGAAVSSTPETELQMAMGHPVAARALGRGVKSSLGIDIVSNFAGDMFAQMRILLQAQRGADNALLRRAPRSIHMKARDAFELATSGGAAAARLDAVAGSLVVGKAADIILIRTDAVHLTPVADPVAALVLYARPSDVDTVLVGGRMLKTGGKLLGVDWPVLRERLLESAERIHVGFANAPVDRFEALAAALMLGSPREAELRAPR